MIGLYRDPNGTTLFKGHAIICSSVGHGSLSQDNPLRGNHVQEIDALRRRIRELESCLNQTHSHDSQTKSSHERSLQMESFNQCFTQQEGLRRGVQFTEGVCFTGDDPMSDGTELPTVMTPCGQRETVFADPDSCLGEGAECNGAAGEKETSKDSIDDSVYQNRYRLHRTI